MNKSIKSILGKINLTELLIVIVMFCIMLKSFSGTTISNIAINTLVIMIVFTFTSSEIIKYSNNKYGRTAFITFFILIVALLISLLIIPKTTKFILAQEKLQSEQRIIAKQSNDEILNDFISFVSKNVNEIKETITIEPLYFPISLDEVVIVYNKEVKVLMFDDTLEEKLNTLEEMVSKDVYKNFQGLKESFKEKGLFIHFNNGSNEPLYSNTGFGLEMIDSFRKDIITENNDNYLIIATYP